MMPTDEEILDFNPSKCVFCPETGYCLECVVKKMKLARSDSEAKIAHLENALKVLDEHSAGDYCWKDCLKKALKGEM